MNTAVLVVYAAVGRSLRVNRLLTATGELELQGAVDLARGDVQYAAMHPSGKYLYVSATDRAATNLIYAFNVDAQTGMLAALGEPFTIPPDLGRAVHIAVDRSGTYVLTAHNVTESVAVLSLESDGRLRAPITRPAVPRLGFLVHQIRADPANTTVFVPVRGDDAQPPAAEQRGRLHLFSFIKGVLRLQHTIEYEAGIGPRHLDFHPTRPWVYLLAERGNVLVTYRRDTSGLRETFRTTTLTNASFLFPAQRAGAIHVHANGQWLYVTNRNVAPGVKGENSIATFSIDAVTGEPTLIQHIDSHGFEPRTFTIDPTGAFLIVGNMMTGARNGDGDRVCDVEPNVSVFRIGADGTLQFVRSYDQRDGQVAWVGAGDRTL